jgi:hypothetical protein
LTEKKEGEEGGMARELKVLQEGTRVALLAVEL